MTGSESHIQGVTFRVSRFLGANLSSFMLLADQLLAVVGLRSLSCWVLTGICSQLLEASFPPLAMWPLCLLVHNGDLPCVDGLFHF